jgi:hypothetical protein
MKKIVTENNQKVLYVQFQDLIYLEKYRNMIPVPESVFSKMFCPSPQKDWVRYSDPKDVEFFEGLDFIADCSDYMDLSLLDITFKMLEVSKAHNKIHSKEHRNESQNMQLHNLCLKMDALHQLYDDKREYSNLESACQKVLAYDNPSHSSKTK